MSDAPLIQVRGLHKSFGKLEVLRGVSFEVKRGEVMAIIGPSGSGKSTLLRCLNFLEEYQAGEILFDNTLVGYRDDPAGRRRLDSERNVRRIRARLGMVFQSFNLFPHKTVLENVIEGPVVVKGQPRAEAEAEARTLIARVGLTDKLDTYPTKLSGGQQQRAAIAARSPLRPGACRMLFDEPTLVARSAGTGGRGAAEVMQVAGAPTGMTMVGGDPRDGHWAEPLCRPGDDDGRAADHRARSRGRQIFGKPGSPRTAEFPASRTALTTQLKNVEAHA
jgi:polar amino acid transport system ATP-binding protein